MSQRKAWNEAMRNAAGGKLPPGLGPSQSRTTRKRREKARKIVSLSSSSCGDAVAYRIDALEEAGNFDQEEDVEDEYDELEEVEGSRGKRRATSRGRRVNKKKAGAMDKRFKPRSLASILIEESGRSDGIVQEYLEAEARPKKGNFLGSYPKRKFCPVSGLYGVYMDPKSQIPYANLDALEHLRERPPPWLSSLGGGSAAYHDAVRSLRNSE